MIKVTCWTITLASLALLVGCGKKDLDRETALRLLQARTFPTVEGQLHADPEFYRFGGDMRAYQALMQLAREGVLICPSFGFCSPKPNVGFMPGGTRYVAGTFRITTVTGVRKVSPNEAVVDATLEFQPTPFYAAHKAALDDAQPDTYTGGTGVRGRTAPRNEQFRFVLYDDGWRVQ